MLTPLLAANKFVGESVEHCVIFASGVHLLWNQLCSLLTVVGEVPLMFPNRKFLSLLGTPLSNIRILRVSLVADTMDCTIPCACHTGVGRMSPVFGSISSAV